MPRYIHEVIDPNGQSQGLAGGWHPSDRDVAEFVGAGLGWGHAAGTRIRIWVAPDQALNTPIGPDDVAGAPIVDYVAR